MQINIPESSLVVLIGPSGAGKTTFAQRHFLPGEILSSDQFRVMLANDDRDQSISSEAFALLHQVLGKRLQKGLLTVVDATSLSADARQQLLTYAKQYQIPAISILFDFPESIYHEHNQTRGHRAWSVNVIKRHVRQMWRVRKQLKKEKFRYQFVLKSREEVDAVRVVRQPLRMDRRLERGPFDLIGDVHGCLPELLELLAILDYQVEQKQGKERIYYHVKHAEGRKVIFVGDLADRGPDSPGVLDLVRDMVNQGCAFAVCGNHDQKLLHYLQGRKVNIAHGFELTIEQIHLRSEQWKRELLHFLQKLPSHYLLDRGHLVVAHAGLPEDMQGRIGGRVRNTAVYGPRTGEVDEYGLPIRENWAQNYQGKAFVVFGHTCVETPVIYHNTVDIDTGCVFGGSLTAMRYPEKRFISVTAKQEYAKRIRPFLRTVDIAPDVEDILSTEKLLNNSQVETRFHSPIRIFAEQSLAAFEEMNRFAVDPRWLIYLPPTMSPSEATTNGEYLEHPRDAFAYYQEHGVTKVICEEKHMGSRAIVIVCRTPQVAHNRFHLDQASQGIIYTRTGRRFFNDHLLEQEILKRLAQAMERVGFWDEHSTDWVCLDCEWMPWSSKAQSLIRNQYAAVGAASEHALYDVVTYLQQAKQDGRNVDQLLELFSTKQERSSLFREAYRHYCWSVQDINDYKLAPFHLMATEGKIYTDEQHDWHLRTLASFCQADTKLFMVTETRTIDLEDESEVQAGVDWWLEKTDQGGEGMVVKPMNFLTRGDKGLIQPAIKCRGREYLRIIYGPDYTTPENLKLLRKRGLKKKRSLAIREFALGLEALQRFVDQEPLQRVHECSFALLALETEPIDPRL